MKLIVQLIAYYPAFGGGVVQQLITFLLQVTRQRSQTWSEKCFLKGFMVEYSFLFASGKLMEQWSSSFFFFFFAGGIVSFFIPKMTRIQN